MKKKHLILSYSKAKVYECPLKYYYQYVKRLPRTSNARNTLPGRAIQKLFELFVNNQEFKNGSKWLYANVGNVFKDEYNAEKEDTRFHVGESYEDVLEEVADMIPNCYDLFIKKGWNTGKIESELSIRVPISPNVDLQGALDFLIVANGKSSIVDFKSTARGIKALDKEQLIIYNILHYKKYGRYPDNTYFFLTRDNQLIKVKITSEDINKMTDKLLSVADGIRKKDFHKKPSKKNCIFCPFKKPCWGEGKKSPW